MSWAGNPNGTRSARLSTLLGAGIANTLLPIALRPLLQPADPICCLESRYLTNAVWVGFRRNDELPTASEAPVGSILSNPERDMAGRTNQIAVPVSEDVEPAMNGPRGL